MIKILQVFHKMDCGGAENFIMNVYRKIDRAQIQFDFIVHSPDKGFFDDEIRALGGQIFYAPEGKLRSAGYKKFWKGFFREHRFAAVHGHMSSMAGIYLKEAKKQGIKTICHSHGVTAGNSLRALIRKFVLRNVEKVADVRLACSAAAGEWLYKRQTFTVIKNGIDVNKYLFSENTRTEKRRELEISDCFVMGHAGRFQEVKNHRFLLDVFRAFHEKNPRSVLLLAGEGVLRGGIEERARQLGIFDSVKFLGLRSDLGELFSAMDYFVFPSLSEGLPLALVEAQASGLQCLVSDTVPYEAAVTDLVCFESLSRGADYWAERMRTKVVDACRTEYNKIVTAAGFDADTTVKELLAIYTGDCT